MFDYSLTHWTTFLTAAVLLNISPGPDIAFILGQTMRNGKKAGFMAMFGIWAGAFIHVILAAVGLSAILATSAIAFSIVKWIGAAYLIWLGWQAIRSNSGSFVSNSKSITKSHKSIFLQGMLIDVLNPKVAIFFLAFLPQFVSEGAGPVAAQLFLHGVLIIVIAAFIEPLMIITGSQLTGYLSKNIRIGLWIDRCLGGLFIALGIKLALSER